MAAMFCVSVNLTSGEWLEICRCYTLAGVEALKQVTSDGERERVAHGFRASMATPGEEKLRD